VKVRDQSIVGLGEGPRPVDIVVHTYPLLVRAGDPCHVAGVHHDRDEIAVVAVAVDDRCGVGRLDIHGNVVFPAGVDDPLHLLLCHPGGPADFDGVGPRRRDVFERFSVDQRLVGVYLHDVVPVRPVAHTCQTCAWPYNRFGYADHSGSRRRSRPASAPDIYISEDL